MFLLQRQIFHILGPIFNLIPSLTGVLIEGCIVPSRWRTCVHVLALHIERCVSLWMNMCRCGDLYSWCVRWTSQLTLLWFSCILALHLITVCLAYVLAKDLNCLKDACLWYKNGNQLPCSRFYDFGCYHDNTLCGRDRVRGDQMARQKNPGELHRHLTTTHSFIHPSIFQSRARWREKSDAHLSIHLIILFWQWRYKDLLSLV